MQQMDWEKLAGKFQFQGRFVDVEPITLGHITRRHRRTRRSASFHTAAHRHHVFQNPPQVMEEHDRDAAPAEKVITAAAERETWLTH